MHRALGRSLLAAGLIVATLGLAAPAHAATIDVYPGHSIQAAINHASPGDTIVVHPGVYHESVKVNKDHLTLRGAGASARGTVIEPPKSTTRCLHGAGGFCVFGEKTAGGMHRRTGVTVEGFVFKGFPAFGLVGFGTANLRVEHNLAVDDGEYGITCFDCTGVQFLFNSATGAGEAGFYVGDSRNANALVEGNRAYGNEHFGFFFRDANVGRATGNKAYGNCSGMALVNSDAPNNVHGWTLVENDAYQNTRFCKGSGDEPAISGVGIWVFGASNNDILHNTVWANHPGGAGSVGSGGIVVQSSAPLGGTKAAGNEIRSNVAYRNKPADIYWDGKGAGNTFTKNKCTTSHPSGLCH